MSDEPEETGEPPPVDDLRRVVVQAMSAIRAKSEAVEKLRDEIADLDKLVRDASVDLIRRARPFKNIVFRAQNSADVESGEEIARNYESIYPSSEELKAAICGALGQPYLGAGSWYIFDLPDLSGREAARISFGIGASYFLVSLEFGTLATAKLLLEEYGIDLSVPDELRLLEERRSDLASALKGVEDRIAALSKDSPGA